MKTSSGNGSPSLWCFPLHDRPVWLDGWRQREWLSSSKRRKPEPRGRSKDDRTASTWCPGFVWPESSGAMRPTVENQKNEFEKSKAKKERSFSENVRGRVRLRQGHMKMPTCQVILHGARCSTNRGGWQAKMATIEFWIPGLNVQRRHWCHDQPLCKAHHYGNRALQHENCMAFPVTPCFLTSVQHPGRS